MKPQSTLRKSLGTQKDFPLQGITKQILSYAIEVHSVLGPGLLESVYEEALAHEFSLRKMRHERQKEICLSYKGNDIGNHRIDYLGEDEGIVELTAVETMHRISEAQVLTYLRALGKRVGLLINFVEGTERITCQSSRATENKTFLCDLCGNLWTIPFIRRSHEQQNRQRGKCRHKRFAERFY